MSESPSVESTNTADADDTKTTTTSEEKETQNLLVLQWIVKLIGDEDGETLSVLQDAGINEPSGLPLRRRRHT